MRLQPVPRRGCREGHIPPMAPPGSTVCSRKGGQWGRFIAILLAVILTTGYVLAVLFHGVR